MIGFLSGIDADALFRLTQTNGVRDQTVARIVGGH